MKRLLILSDNQQEQDIKNLLEKNEILYRQTNRGAIELAAIWVMDSDYQKAKEIVETYSLIQRDSARKDFKKEWETKWKGSYINWLIGTMSPLKLFKLIVLIFILSLLIYYPIYSVLK